MIKNLMKNSVAWIALLAVVGTAQAADRLEGRLVTESLTRSGKILDRKDTLETRLTTTIDRVVERVVWELQPVTDIECREVPGDGKGDWKGFYNVTKDKKANALADAIKGIGIKTAEKMVRDGYFHRKPRTWAAFKEEINRAQDQYGGNIAYEVLVKYGDDNARSLGYYSETDCETVVRYVRVPRLIEERIPYRTVSRKVRLELERGTLLLGETERFEISFDGFDDSVRVRSDFNSYQVVRQDDYRDETTYRLVGVRLTVTPSNALNAVISSKNGKVMVNLTDLTFDREYADELGEGVVTLEIYQVRTLWFDKKLTTLERRLDAKDALTEIDTGFRPEAGVQVYVQYRLKRLGSPYFNHSVSSNKSSNKIRF